MIIIIESILPIFSLVIIGYLLRKSNFIAAPNWCAVEDLCFWLFLPALLMHTLITMDFTQVKYGPFALTLLASVLTICLLLLLAWPVLRFALQVSPAQYSTIFQTGTRWHGFIALAIVLNLYGQEGVLLIGLAFMFMIPLLQVVNIFVLVAFSPVKDVSGAIMVLRNPIFIGVMAGLIVNLTHIQLWNPLLLLLDLFGQAALATSLLALGASLSLRAAFKPSYALFVGVVSKLVLTPIIVLVYAHIFDVTGLELSVLLVSAAVPTAMNGYILAKKMDGDVSLYSSTATVQVLLSFLTIPAVIWLAKKYLGGI